MATTPPAGGDGDRTSATGRGARCREDYSADGEAWWFFPHELARSKAYRWGEDGIAGLCDRYQLLVFAPAFWNEKDRILKERLFGVNHYEGNHGEDVKECYFHLDNTPTHSYMRFLYKYPQAEFPYESLVAENQRRAGQGAEYELFDTGVFDEDRYFDIFIEYAKVDEEDILIRIEAFNRGPEAAPLHILPQLWFRNTWGWTGEAKPRPTIEPLKSGSRFLALVADDTAGEMLRGLPTEYRLGPRIFYADSGGEILLTENETNVEQVFGATYRNATPYVKDSFHRYVVDGEECVRREGQGTKSAIHYQFAAVEPGESVTVRLRLSDKAEVASSVQGLRSSLQSSASAKRMSFTRAFIRGVQVRTRRKFSGRHSPGCCGRSRRIYLTSMSGWPEIIPPGSRRSRVITSATSIGSI